MNLCIITVLSYCEYNTIRLYLWSFLTCGRADTLNPRQMRHRQHYQNCTVYSSTVQCCRFSVWLQHSLFVFLPQSKQKIPLIPLSPHGADLAYTVQNDIAWERPQEIVNDEIKDCVDFRSVADGVAVFAGGTVSGQAWTRSFLFLRECDGFGIWEGYRPDERPPSGGLCCYW